MCLSQIGRQLSVTISNSHCLLSYHLLDWIVIIAGESFGKHCSTHSLLCRQISLYRYQQFQHFIPNFGMIQVLAESTVNSELQSDRDFCFQRWIPNRTPFIYGINSLKEMIQR